MSKRPTDHLIPSAKKRSGDRQISREEPPSDSDEEVVAGEFRRADEGTLKQRRIFKARRGVAAAVPSSAAAPALAAQPGATGANAAATPAMASNPFAGISLTVPATGGNPFAGVSLIPPAAAAPAPAAAAASQDARKEPAKEDIAGEDAPAAAATAEATAEDGKEAAAQEPAAEAKDGVEKASETPNENEAEGAAAATTSGKAEAEADAEGPAMKEGSGEAEGAAKPGGSGGAFATFASASGTGFGGLASAGTAAGNGFGGFGTSGGFGALSNGSSFGALGSTGAAPVFGVAAESTPPASTSFSFNTGASSGSSFSFSTTPAATSSFPSVHNIFGSNNLPPTSVFGGGQETRPAVLPLPEEEPQRVTGEEEERCVFSGDGVLFEYIEAQWRERGRGELRVNVAGGGQARLVMRQRGNLRLLLNANLYSGMKLTPMDGGKGTTFACVNAAASADAGSAKKDEEGKGGEGGHLGTFAFRVKVPAKLEEFISAAQAHIPPAEPQLLGNENNV